jgi:hypothetical protein
MSDKNKGKPSKSVMGNLPSTRPTRMARRRDGEGAANRPPEPAPAAEKRKPAAAKAKPKRPVAKPKAAAATTQPKQPVAKPKTAPAPAATTQPEPGTAKPRAVRSGSPSLPAAKKAPRTQRRPPAPSRPKGAEIVTTAVQATGELAKIGLTLGGQALKRAVDRLPKP